MKNNKTLTAAVAITIVLKMMALSAMSLSACRQGDPTGEPKTPPNLPFPQVDKKEPDPKSAPTLPGPGDAG